MVLSQEATNLDKLRKNLDMVIEVYCYAGKLEKPKFRDVDPGVFRLSRRFRVGCYD
jgi:hypothetical protein